MIWLFVSNLLRSLLNTNESTQYRIEAFYQMLAKLSYKWMTRWMEFQIKTEEMEQITTIHTLVKKKWLCIRFELKIYFLVRGLQIKLENEWILAKENWNNFATIFSKNLFEFVSRNVT